ncbi:MAG: hypothetical protein AAB443_00010 [Patescibacteria group bacterium]
MKIHYLLKDPNEKVIDVFSLGVEVLTEPFVEALGVVPPAGSYKPICPNNVLVREKRLKEVEETLNTNLVTSIWLYNLHFPTVWNAPEPTLLDTCYCKHCITNFSAYLGGESLPTAKNELVEAIEGQYYIEWLEFKCKTITSFVEDVKKLIGVCGRTVKLGIFVPPWNDKEYGSGITRLLGLDLYTLSGLVDVISPMLFYKELARDLEWVGGMLDYYKAFTGAKIIPSFVDNLDNLACDKLIVFNTV